MNSSEKLKEVVDAFGRLSFMLETYVKLVQTGDHREVANEIFRCCVDDAQDVHKKLLHLLNPEVYEQG